MAPVRPKSRLSDRYSASTKGRGDATGASKAVLPDSPLTPQHRSPAKRTRMRITLQQKQALIDNLQLEITERARRLRAQYNLQAQGLRSRIEIRVNRIPTALRKIKMGDLVLKYLEQEQKRTAEGRPTALPVKDSRLSPQKLGYGSSRSQAPDRSGELAGDKENELDNAKGEKKARAVKGADSAATHPTQVLSPTSSNSRLANRDLPPSPVKSRVAKPGSPLKTHGTGRTAAMTSVLSSMMEKAKATRHGVGRKVTATSDSSSSSQAPTAAAKGRRPATAMAMASARAPAPPRPATRAGHRASGTSETSEGSTSTVVRKPGVTSTVKKTTMGAIRKGVTGGTTKKTTTTAKNTTASTSAKAVGRVLRKRG
ncbi:hypothetical protein HIM_07991 [Hirsutella minnesotensis 3608]|uniref:Borealin N-terminal domain-containing protein n=1 Tax=Hirsutella minnesotensis 3608 TaxID=1043627 RepID=A0A0F7ZYK5_9HYPO|nr:hypothetical protein HIM_07991 [Hirsutella minnesotensis 3608]